MSMAMEPTTNTLQSLATEQLDAAFPQYEIEAELGRGGMGAVYRARHRKLDRLVALKVLLPEHDGPEFAERFEREARALAKLDHVNIVGVQDIGEADGLYYLVMDYVDGADLRQLLNAGGLSVKDALTWVPQICDALQYAHDQGVVHRDIKPENVLVDQDGQVRIADFGLAKVLTSDGADVTLTHARQGLGTPHYMAPEQVASAGEVDHRADIYSLGVMLYELLTGELPIGRFEPPSHKSKSTRALDDVVMKSLESDPARRYQSARDVKSGITGLPERSPSAISRYRKELSEKSERAVGTSDPERRQFPKVAWGSWAAFAMVLAAAFMTWVKMPTKGMGVMLMNAWNGTFAGLPVWLQLFVGLAIAVIRNLRVRSYQVPRAVTLVLSGFGTLFCSGLVLGAAAAPDATARAGSLITMLCMGGWLVVEIMECLEERRPPAPQQPRRRVRRPRSASRRAAARRS
jgi:tRNA A-37 threonylcarbamoyl transferase component Bud32